jgi:hypothetical protein
VAKISFTDVSIRNLAPPAKGQQSYWDKELAGFGLRMSQGGSKTWIILDPRSKIRTQETIGRYPLVTLKEARQEARTRLALYTPGKTKNTHKAWQSACEEFLDHIKRNRKPRTHLDYERLLGKFKFQTSPMRDITQDALVRKLDKLKETPAERRLRRCAARQGSAKRRSTTGGTNTAGCCRRR